MKNNAVTIENYFQNTKIAKSSPITFTVANKISHKRRPLQVVNPEGYLNLCIHLTNLLKKTKFGLTNNKILNLRYKAAKKDFDYYPHSVIQHQKNIDMLGYRYLIYIDISKFYPSIYTHSISWAVLGKNVAKSERLKQKKSSTYELADKVDAALRMLNDDQTKGIPIGATVFSVVAKLITDRLDIELTDFLKINKIHASFSHYVDDYFVFCETESDANLLLSAFTNILNKYDLHLNDDKTRIELAEKISLVPYWVNVCSELIDLIKGLPSAKRNEARFIQIFERFRMLMRKNYHGEQVASYFISSLINWMETTQIKSRLFEKCICPFILQTCFLEPAPIRYLTKKGFVDCFNQLAKKSKYKQKYKDIILCKIPSYCMKNYYTHELIWSLTVIRHLSFQSDFMKTELYENLKEYDCPLVKCLICQIALDIEDQDYLNDLYKETRKGLVITFNTSSWLIYLYLCQNLEDKRRKILIKECPSDLLKRFLSKSSRTFFDPDLIPLESQVVSTIEGDESSV